MVRKPLSYETNHRYRNLQSTPRSTFGLSLNSQNIVRSVVDCSLINIYPLDMFPRMFWSEDIAKIAKILKYSEIKFFFKKSFNYPPTHSPPPPQKKRKKKEHLLFYILHYETYVYHRILRSSQTDKHTIRRHGYHCCNVQSHTNKL